VNVTREPLGAAPLAQDLDLCAGILEQAVPPLGPGPDVGILRSNREFIGDHGLEGRAARQAPGPRRECGEPGLGVTSGKSGGNRRSSSPLAPERQLGICRDE
jgi:hypothetical protein